MQCLPIAGLRDRQAHDLANSVITSMTEQGMKVAGMCLKKKFLLVELFEGFTENLTAFAGKAIHAL